jgi:thiol-disulfide isomerase/thioredoxin
VLGIGVFWRRKMHQYNCKPHYMKHPKIQFILFSLLLHICCLGQKSQGYRIDGTFKNADGQKIYLIKRGQMKFDYEKTIFIDSTIVKNGRFVFSGRVKEPDYYSILYKNDWKPFILDNSTLTFVGDAKEYLHKSKISGSKEIQWDEELRNSKEKFITLLNTTADSSMAADSRGDTLLAKLYADSNQAWNKKMYEKDRQFIATHPNAFVSLFFLDAGYKDFGFKDSKNLFNKLSKNLKNHSLGKEVAYKIFEGEHIAALNAKAITFSQADTAGNNISLSSFRGKYLLIDFWASWCIPCRAENPNIKNAYKNYKSKGFEVLGISLDNDKDAWVKAIIKDGLTWTHVSDLKGWKNEVAKKYIVNAVPANYLLDPEGKIIAKDLRGEDLLKKLTELFGQ